MNSLMKKIVYIALGIVALGIIALCIYNGIMNQSFWNISVFNGITMLWTIGVSFILTQQFGRYNKQVDVVHRILDKLLELINESETCRIHPTTESENLLMRNRQIHNQLGSLSSCADKFGIKNDIEFLEKMFNEYEEIIGEHIRDIDYLSKSESTLSRPINNMRDKIYAIMLKL
ncbi:MAG: hypothetical protein IKK08_10445 [Clostridia bacterium]|nr:hypothetical protein [Clostridia bacterium]MBR4069028.1 hypothetical protein [Clostridia bacterium]